MKRLNAVIVGMAMLTAAAASGQQTVPPAPRDPAAAKPGTVLITGSNRGLGLEFTKQYAARGWTVIATARHPEAAAELRSLAAENGNVAVETLDLADPAAIEALAAKYRGKPVDVIVNNAGVLGDLDKQKLGSFDYAEFENVMAVNVYGALAVAEAFRANVAASEHKKIVSITSGSGMISVPGNLGPYFYRASKVALNMVMKVLADDVRASGVIVGVIAPGTADTDMRRSLVGAERASRDQTPAAAVAAMMKVIDGLTLEQSGLPFNYTGKQMPW
jgi:NAD(P)-dependent dehydrogenase (short-subunit alcohol dehydrogenase family)